MWAVKAVTAAGLYAVSKCCGGAPTVLLVLMVLALSPPTTPATPRFEEEKCIVNPSFWAVVVPLVLPVAALLGLTGLLEGVPVVGFPSKKRVVVVAAGLLMS